MPDNRNEAMKLGDLIGWIAAVITCVSSLAAVVFAPALFLSDLALLLAAVAAAKRCFTPALATYGLWLLFHFGLFQYHQALLNTTNQAHGFVVFEFVLVNAIFTLGLCIGLVSLIKKSLSGDGR